MFLIHAPNQFFGTYSRGTGAYHDRSPVRIVSAKIQALIAADFLEADPDIRL
jgi:hypothetical protein